MDKLLDIGKFLRIVDNNNQLSITNIALIVILIKLSIAPTASITEAGALLITLANYGHKKHIESNKERHGS